MTTINKGTINVFGISLTLSTW